MELNTHTSLELNAQADHCSAKRKMKSWLIAVDRVHHGECVYEVLFALMPWCLRKGDKRIGLTLLTPTTPTPMRILTPESDPYVALAY